MTKPPLQKPTASELEILRVLWERGPSTVRDVHEALREKKDLGYTHGAEAAANYDRQRDGAQKTKSSGRTFMKRASRQQKRSGSSSETCCNECLRARQAN